jgi:hypothetical protein
MATPASFDGSVNVCRVMYRSGPFGAGGGRSADEGVRLARSSL